MNIVTAPIAFFIHSVVVWATTLSDQGTTEIGAANAIAISTQMLSFAASTHESFASDAPAIDTLATPSTATPAPYSVIPANACRKITHFNGSDAISLKETTLESANTVIANAIRVTLIWKITRCVK